VQQLNSRLTYIGASSGSLESLPLPRGLMVRDPRKRAPPREGLRPHRSAKCRGGERWIREIKLDGYQVQVHVANNAVKIFTPRGNDYTKRFKTITDDA
jgi:hypothetical protein